MATGENEQALRKIIDLTRLLSIVLLIAHFYFFTYTLLREVGISNIITDKIVNALAATGIFRGIYFSKSIVMLLLVISLIGAVGRKDEKVSKRAVVLCIVFGLILFFASHSLFALNGNISYIQIGYIIMTSIGYLLVLAGGTLLSRMVKISLSKDIFNRDNESFPQEERKIENEYSINLPAAYSYKGRRHLSWINIINPFRALLIIGTPGAGKTYFVVRHVINQHITKGFTMFLYDFKYDDLTRIAYNALLNNYDKYKVRPKFYVINFEDLSHSHRCNPLDPASMQDITDATESSRTIMLGLNRDWIKKQGDFFVESPINFLTAMIWFLRKLDDGKYCTLPHVIELMQLDYVTLFKLLQTEPEIEVLINPFESAFRNKAMEQLEGQIASAKIGMARLSSPQLYYILSGNDFTLDVNNSKEPKIVCIGNNPQKTQVYGAVLSLYTSRMLKLVNRKGQEKLSIVFDEFATQYQSGFDQHIAVARSNRIATTLAFQDFSQLKRDYGRDMAEVIMNLVGNIISGQVVGETAKSLSERFGRIVQDRQSVSINSNDTSLSRSTQLDSAIPASKIAALSSGEFVGTVSDDPLQRIDLKTFHAEILNDHGAIKAEEKHYRKLPLVRKVTPWEVQQNYLKIKQDIRTIIETKI